MRSRGLFCIAHEEVRDASLECVITGVCCTQETHHCSVLHSPFPRMAARGKERIDSTWQIAGALSNLIPAGPATPRGEHRGVVGALYPPSPLPFDVSAPLYLPPAGTEPPSWTPCPTRPPPRHSPESDAHTARAKGTWDTVGVASRCGCCCPDCLGPAKVGCEVEDGASAFPSLSA